MSTDYLQYYPTLRRNSRYYPSPLVQYRREHNSFRYQPHYHVLYEPKVMRVDGQSLFLYSPSMIYKHPLRYIPLISSTASSAMRNL
ncbi:unnamed protein product [Hymenolepis diminuta]|uniref:Uncharacterized protein n=1 Tax=Hymenolepis diminuta TaxID=6216 RepID=A0A564YP33_HYMDI|nr:unnamed protein product [Hymenolepis diminuta]